MSERYLKKSICDDLKEKMVFVGGPRQVGKTTMALDILGADDRNHPAYLNWDINRSKKILQTGEVPTNQPLLILDEVHKYKKWRNLVKGFFDEYKNKKQILVTGSARLDYYRRGGDSLQGRYHYYRLHPFSLFELNSKPNSGDLQTLLEFGGFPEPLFKANTRHYKRWQLERRSRVLQEDLISLEFVKDLSHMELLADALPTRVGSVLSVANLREDLGVAFETAERWIQILERLYFCFRISPYGPPQIKAAKKEKKLYMWDWSVCESKGAKFENFIASQLLKYCHFLEDSEGDKMDLRFIRDPFGREIDFVVLKNKKPIFAVECKTGEGSLSKHIAYFAQRTTIPLFYQVHTGTKDTEIAGVRARILPATALAGLLKV